MSNIEDIIKMRHEDDKNQIEAIFSERKKIMLVAPAGCGKTKTLISKISYLLCTDFTIINAKKILALTFSVNAAFKIKKDVLEFCPSITNLSNEFIKSKITISNYHGLARMILAKYGYLLDDRLRKINEIIPINEQAVTDLSSCTLSVDDKEFMKKFSEKVAKCDRTYVDENIVKYYLIMIKLLDMNLITFNSYLVFLILLFKKNLKLLNFYQNIFSIIMIDEFQDTNYLSWIIVKLLATKDSKLFFMGDKLQRIYGFIGAIPELIEEAISTLDMKEIRLDKNYRFIKNSEMLLLDTNIRKNSDENIVDIKEDANVRLKILNNVDEEITYAKDIIKYVKEKNSKLAILVRSRSGNLNKILCDFDKTNVNYFFALFSENDPEYIKFHINCLKVFSEMYVGEGIGKKLLNNVYGKIFEIYQTSSNKVVKSLLVLLELFFKRINLDYYSLSEIEKDVLITDTFNSRSLKQNMDLVDANIIVSTIHGAKGLEWDYVYLPSLNDYTFPNYSSLCKYCKHTNNGNYCKINIQKEDNKSYLEELSIFYVGITRARNEVFFSAPLERINSKGIKTKAYVSCLLSQKGIKINLV